MRSAKFASAAAPVSAGGLRNEPVDALAVRALQVVVAG